MQVCAFGAQQFAGHDANFHVRGNGFLVKAVGLTGQLDFAVQRLVRNTQ